MNDGDVELELTIFFIYLCACFKNGHKVSSDAHSGSIELESNLLLLRFFCIVGAS